MRLTELCVVVATAASSTLRIANAAQCDAFAMHDLVRECNAHLTDEKKAPREAGLVRVAVKR